MPLAATLLVTIGTLEAQQSARQLEEIGRASRLAPAGAGLTALGALASAVVYILLGRGQASDRAALRAGLAAGAAAGLLGGAIRAVLIAEGVRGVIARYVVLPDGFVTLVLAVFVAACVAVSCAAGAACALGGRRWARGESTPPRA